MGRKALPNSGPLLHNEYMKQSPYLESADRLGDVIAAIQVMGTYKFYKLTFASWSDRIHGHEGAADHWKKVFEQHPEFFRLDAAKERASLVWRRQHQKRYNVDTETHISRQDFFELPEDEKKRISRAPLASSEIATLMQTAINLHSRALQQKQELRWWVAGALGLVGVLLGALLR